jgi:hypothetical protein
MGKENTTQMQVCVLEERGTDPFVLKEIKRQRKSMKLEKKLERFRRMCPDSLHNFASKKLDESEKRFRGLN